jgi:hypothetical protein
VLWSGDAGTVGGRVIGALGRLPFRGEDRRWQTQTVDVDALLMSGGVRIRWTGVHWSCRQAVPARFELGWGVPYRERRSEHGRAGGPVHTGKTDD